MNRTAWKTPCAKLNLSSISNKLLTRLRLKFSHLSNLKFHRKLEDRLRTIVTVVLELKQLNTFFLRCQFLASEIHNLHDDPCLIDPTVISFGGESQLNVLLYGSDKFNAKVNKEIVLRIIPNKADDTWIAERVHGHPIFCVEKIKRETKGKKKEFQSRDY